MASGSFPQTSTAATGRQDSSANGSLREANLQRRLSGDESGEVSVANRPSAAVRRVLKRTFNGCARPPAKREALGLYLGLGAIDENHVKTPKRAEANALRPFQVAG